jgi:hypothetical protein
MTRHQRERSSLDHALSGFVDGAQLGWATAQEPAEKLQFSLASLGSGFWGVAHGLTGAARGWLRRLAASVTWWRHDPAGRSEISQGLDEARQGYAALRAGQHVLAEKMTRLRARIRALTSPDLELTWRRFTVSDSENAAELKRLEAKIDALLERR